MISLEWGSTADTFGCGILVGIGTMIRALIIDGTATGTDVSYFSVHYTAVGLNYLL